MEQQKLDLQHIEAGIQSRPLVRKIVREVLLFDRVDSTNHVAMKMGAAGHPGRALILAEEQDKGRGRLNRAWISPPGVNLYLSLLFCPCRPVYEFPLFSLAASVALVTAIQSATGLIGVIKWPNDVLLNDKKVAGILLQSGKGPSLVIGIGVNVNWEMNDIPSTLSATSLKMAWGQAVDRSEWILHLLAALSEQINLLEAGEKKQMIQTFSEHCNSLGKRVEIQSPHQRFEGVAERILSDGGLLLRLGDGKLRKVVLGDVTHLTS